MKKMFKKSADKIKKNCSLLLIASLTDLLFFLVYGFITRPLFAKLMDYIIIIGAKVSENSASIMQDGGETIREVLLSDPETSRILSSIILIYIILGAVIYILYVFFNSIAWKLSSDIHGEKVGFYEYLKRFALVNILWVFMIYAYHFISFSHDLKNSALEVAQIEPSRFWGFVILIIPFAILYFASISYALISLKSKSAIRTSFKIGFRKAKEILPAYLLVITVYFTLNFLLFKIGAHNFNLMIILGVLTIIPGMTLARVFFTEVVKNAGS